MLWRLRAHLGAGVPRLLCTASEIFCSTFPTDGANCDLLNSQSQWIVGAFTNWLQPAKIDTKTKVVFRRPSDDKVSLFLEDLELLAIVILIRNPVPYLV